MWALRRAANPLRSQNCRSMVARANVLVGNYEHGGHFEGESRLPGGYMMPYSHEPAVSVRSFFWGRTLSSQTGNKAGAKAGDSEDELEGFSDLDTPPETDKIENSVEKEDLEVGSEGDISEEELDEAAEGGLGLLDVGTEASGEKPVSRKSVVSPLSKTLIDSPMSSMKSALDKWVGEGKALGRSEIYLLILNLRRRRLYGKALQLFEWVEANKHLEFTERDYASYLDLTAKVHGVQRAQKFMEKVPESFRGEIMYRTLLANCVASGNIIKSEEIFNKMRDLGFPITTFACNQLLLLYKRNDRKKIADVLKLMETEDVKPSVFTYSLLIDTKGRAHDISGMEELVEMMKGEGMEPDTRIRAMLAKHYIFANYKDRAEEELKKIEGEDIKENRAACRELLPLYAALGKADDVERIWKVCEADPRLEECFAVIEAWGKLGEIEKAENVFELMTKNWKRLSARYYNALIKVYAQHKLLSKGKDLAKRMSENGCRIGPLTWDALVKLYIGAGEVEKADSILQKATQQNQIKPLYSSYMAVLDQYAKRGDVHNAEKIFQKVRQNGYAGRMRLYQSLLEAYVKAKTPAYGFRERMKADNMFPSKTIAAELAAMDGGFKKSQISELLD